MRYGLSWLGALFVYIGVKIVVISGGIFEATLKYTIVEFGRYLQMLKPGIDVGWTALRDIANIIIIGLFVFIAVNIILGVKDFGDKKRVAHVLIVAVLINFSLLFTKVIVDASNFTAYQFYNQMIGGLEKRTETIAGVQVGSSVIAVKFMQLLGVQGISDSQDKLLKIGEDNKNAFYALGYGFISLIFLLATSAVFLYGAFLIVSRAVLIVFLMLTSAVAFATWLIPQQYVQGGFAKWWESLLKAAFFAPILIALIWITTIVSDTLVKSGLAKGGTLGKLAENASSEANIAALFSMILILGLLFAAFATANAFSKTISGFRFAQGGVMTALGIASRAGGIAGRFTLGAAAGGAFKGLRNAGASDYWAGRMAMRPLRWLGQKSYDPMSVGAVRRTAERLSGFVLGGDRFGEQGYLGGRQRQARKAEELARAMRPPETARNALSAAAQANEQATIDAQRRGLDQSAVAHIGAARGADREGMEEENRVRDTQQAERDNIRNVARPAAQATAEAVRQQVATEQGRLRDMEESYRNQIQSTQRERISAAEKATRTAELEGQRSSARAAFESIISQRTQDLQTHEAALQRLDQRVEQLDRQASRAGQDITDATREYAEAHLENIERDRRALGGGTAERLRQAGQQATARYEVRAIADAIVGSKLTPFRRGIRDELGGAIEQHNLEQAVAAFARAQRAAQGPPAPAPAPAPPPNP